MPEPRVNANARLRDYLHADLCDFVSGVEARALAQGDTALATEARRVHQARLDALQNDEEVRGIARFDLPKDHPEGTDYGGDPGDRFVLTTADNRLIPDTVTPKMKMNRADRRRSGQRGRGLNFNGNGEHADD